jgi:hypothetical protein
MFALVALLRAGAADGVEIRRRAVSAALRASLSIYVVFFATIAAAIFLPDVVRWLPKHSPRSRLAALRARAAPAISARDRGASPASVIFSVRRI